jgi:hypothetical protein
VDGSAGERRPSSRWERLEVTSRAPSCAAHDEDERGDDEGEDQKRDDPADSEDRESNDVLRLSGAGSCSDQAVERLPSTATINATINTTNRNLERKIPPPIANSRSKRTNNQIIAGPPGM